MSQQKGTGMEKNYRGDGSLENETFGEVTHFYPQSAGEREFINNMLENAVAAQGLSRNTFVLHEPDVNAAQQGIVGP